MPILEENESTYIDIDIDLVSINLIRRYMIFKRLCILKTFF